MTVLRAAAAAAVLVTCACGSSSTSTAACKGATATAVAGPAQSIAKRLTAQLAGSALGTHGDVAYAWQLDAVPPGSSAALSSASSATPSFTADVAGSSVATLYVRDACGASAPATTVVTATNHAPTAAAGADQHVAPGDTVTLDGSASSDADQDPITYQWSLIVRPAGSAAALTLATAKSPKFVADQPGTYVALLLVSDAAATSAPAQVVVQAGNPGDCVAPPTAVTGPAVTAAKHTSVQLAGGALGAHGSVTYAWKFDAIPAGSSATISSPSVYNASFTADVSGVYVASLVVRDACGQSAASTTVVTVANRRPVAAGGPDQHVMPGDTVTLDGSASSDPDQDALTYRWSFLSVPPGSSATFSSPTTKSTTLVPDVYGNYLVLLVVSDGEAFSDPVQVLVQAGVTGPGAGCIPAAAPVASAGHDQTISYGSVFLDGSASTTGRAGTLGYRWTLTSAPAGSNAYFDNASIARTFLNTDRPGVFVVSLVVNDGCANSAPATARMTRPNTVPTATIYGPYQPVPVLLPVVLQSSAYDPDNDTLTFQWQVVSAPQGSTAALSSATAIQPTFAPDVAGTYSISLVVSDGVSSSQPASATFTAVNQPPLAGVGPDQASGLGATVNLDGSTSADPSHRTLTYAWTLQTPGGSAATLSATNVVKPTFVSDVAGVYKAKLAVSAGGLTSTLATTTIAVWPPIAALAHRVLDAAYSTALDRVVMVAADPNALYLYNPRGPAEATVALSLPPSSLSLSPDGKFAAVGHANAISYVDLQQATVSQVLAVAADVARVSLGDNGFVYAFPRAPLADHIRMLAVPLGAGSEPAVTSSLVGGPIAKVRRLAGTLYLSSNTSGYGYGGIEEYALSGGTPALITPVSVSNVYSCGDLWLSQAATRLFTKCGSVLRASSSFIDDFSAAGTLAHANANFSLRHLDDSTAAGEVSAVASPDSQYNYPPLDDRTLRRWDANGLTAREVLLFPSVAGSGTSFQWSGRFVFYRSDGTERYVILQLDPAAGALHDFGVVTF